MFQIVRIAPTYCQFTDAIIGSSQHRLPMPYTIEALAHKIAGILSQREYDGFGDDHFVVVPYGESAFAPGAVRREVTVIDPAFDDMPF
jgi:hypothetical protein